jgi:UDP-2,3-diacylglucosamine hydrolase
MLSLTLQPGKKLYFASDFHLAAHHGERGREREQAVLRWLEYASTDAQAIFLLGDLFDFWFEYRKVVPKGFVRFLGKLAALREAGIECYVFSGNHDLWLDTYFPQELDIPIFQQPTRLEVRTDAPTHPVVSFLIGHGDGLGPGDWAYRRVLKPIFTNRFLQWAFRWLHPDVGVWLAHQWSSQSRLSKGLSQEFRSEETEWIFQFCKSVEFRQHHDYYVFGHRHLPLDLSIGPRSRYLNLGEWFHARTYGVYDGKKLGLIRFQDSAEAIFHAV